MVTMKLEDIEEFDLKLLSMPKLEVVFGLTTDETWIIRKRLGIFDNKIPILKDIANSDEYKKRFKTADSNTVLMTTLKKIESYYLNKQKFQKKYLDTKMLLEHLQIKKISNAFQDIYYIGELEKSDLTSFSLKKIILSSLKVVYIYTGLNCMLHIDCDVLFEDVVLLQYLKQKKIDTLHDLTCYENFILDYYASIKNEEDYYLIGFFPLWMIESFLANGIYTFKELQEYSVNDLLKINQHYALRVLDVVNKFLNSNKSNILDRRIIK